MIKGQVERELDLLRRGAERDPRVEVVLEDLPTDEHLRLFAAADVCVAPSRWEGLGLHLYESMALGLPVITNDAPPMNEVIADGDNGLLFASPRPRAGEVRDPGLPDQRPRPARGAIERVAEPGRLAELRARGRPGARAARLGAHGRRLRRAGRALRVSVEQPDRAVEAPADLLGLGGAEAGPATSSTSRAGKPRARR